MASIRDSSSVERLKFSSAANASEVVPEPEGNRGQPDAASSAPPILHGAITPAVRRVHVLELYDHAAPSRPARSLNLRGERLFTPTPPEDAACANRCAPETPCRSPAAYSPKTAHRRSAAR